MLRGNKKKINNLITEAEFEAMALKIEHEKRLILYTGVSFFMILFISMWFFSFRQEVQTSVPELKAQDTVDGMLSKLKQSLFDTQDSINQVKKQVTNLTGTTTEVVSSTTSRELDIDALNIEIKKSQAEDLNMATGTLNLPVSE
ncbi:MAG: hypothetical protein WCG01_02640 [bacterium]